MTLFFMDFNKTPFSRIAIPLILGIIFSIFIAIPLQISIAISFLFLISSIYFHYAKSSKKYLLSFFYGISLFLFCFFIGVFLSELRQVKKIQINENEEVEYIARITETIEEKENSIKTVLEIEKPSTDSSQIETFKTLVYFQKNQKALNLNFNDRIVLNAKISSIKNNGNPFEFDYEIYLARKGIFYQVYLKEEDFIYLEPDKAFSVYALADNLRSYLLNIFIQNNIKDEELSVLSALTLGYKAYLESDTKIAFSETGAMHVLAVSGLHVGVILGVLTFFFKAFSGNKVLRVIKLVSIIFSLWAFAFISGLSPSVLRAALMFSFVAFGDFSNRSGSIYNSLWGSALILLIFNPVNFLDVGFQLSYSAVFGIVSMQPIIYKSIYVPTKLGDFFWSLISVSIAAQLGTTPLCLMYFNQFPTYFILTNILVIPLAFLIIYSALALIVISKLAFISTWVAIVLNFIVKALNSWVHFIQELPFSSIQQMELELSEVLLLYLFIAFLFLFFAFQRKLFLRLSLLFLLISSSSNIYGNYKKAQTHYFVVYNINKASCFNFVSADKNILVCDSALAANTIPIEFAAKNFWTQVNTTYPNLEILENSNVISKSETAFSDENLFFYKNLKVGYLGEESPNNISYQKKIKLDFVIISKNCKFELAKIQTFYKAKKIILDSSNNLRQIKKREDEAKELKLDLHIVSKEGAFVYSFD